MLVVGLTGGIGSGKTTVAELFQQLANIPTIDTDQLAREAVLPGSEALAKITEYFGSGILLHDGSLDRKQLRLKIFSDARQRIWLENLLHPIIRNLMAEKLHALNAPYSLVQIPLLVEREPNPLIQRILLVDTSAQIQEQRVQLRDHLDNKTIEAIMATQAQRDALLRAADDVIVNDSSLDDLKEQVLKLNQNYLQLCAKPSE